MTKTMPKPRQKTTTEREVASCLMPSPVGALYLVTHDDGVQRIDFAGGGEPSEEGAGSSRANAWLRQAKAELAEYFAGSRRTFDLALAPAGTPFQLEVWRALSAIPYGETISYAELARRVGRPGAQRAVGSANGANPLSIVVPCHRVIGADGSLTGYGGGLERKRVLLALEGALAQPALSEVHVQPSSPEVDDINIAKGCPTSAAPEPGSAARPRRNPVSRGCDILSVRTHDAPGVGNPPSRPEPGRKDRSVTEALTRCRDGGGEN